MIRQRIKNLIKKSDRLYAIARCIKNINDPNYLKLVKGYFEVCDCTSVLLEHKGEKYPNKIIYHIGFCMPDNKKTAVRDTSGFCALLRKTLLSMSFPDALGMTPVVEWGSKSVYYDSGMDSVTLNVFEYYFEPVAKICSDEVEDCKNVVDVTALQRSMANSFFFMERASDMFASYCIEEREFERLSDLYKKYIHLNDKTKKYIDDQINEILDDESILAVHVRGTDFNLGTKNHPIAIMPEECLETVKQVYSEGIYKKIFLATDDENALELFKGEFKDKLLYYKDAFRTESHVGAHATLNNRPFHHYKLGLEILRDIYTLANCDSLVCGLSQVSFAARYVNLAMGRKYSKIVVIDHGVNKESSLEAVKAEKQLRKIEAQNNNGNLHRSP